MGGSGIKVVVLVVVMVFSSVGQNVSLHSRRSHLGHLVFFGCGEAPTGVLLLFLLVS